MSDHGRVGAQLPIGVVLAGGSGRRIGGAKATVRLRGRPLISYPLAALSGVLDEVAVLAKPDTALPSLPGLAVWIEPGTPSHPLFGILHALRLAGGRAVLTCAADLPFVTGTLLSRLAFAAASVHPPVALAVLGGQLQPLLGCYHPASARLLSAALAADPHVSLREAVTRLDPALVEVVDPAELFNINTPEDLRRAEAMLAQPKVKA